jgi:hypothetical protein
MYRAKERERQPQLYTPAMNAPVADPAFEVSCGAP